MNTNFIKTLDDETLNKIADAQMADLIERRKIQDPDYFKECFRRSFDARFDPYGEEPRIIDKIVENFTEIAGEAFHEYHQYRAMQKAEAEAGDFEEYDPEEAQPDADVDNTESENEGGEEVQQA